MCSKSANRIPFQVGISIVLKFEIVSPSNKSPICCLVNWRESCLSCIPIPFGRDKGAPNFPSLFRARSQQQTFNCDIVIMDGNIAHGVTRVQRDNVKRAPTERFSAILFCTWNRRKGMCKPGPTERFSATLFCTWNRRKGMCKPGRYTGYYNN